jgi:hypothetical protein
MFGRAYVRESLLWIVAFVLTFEGSAWLAGQWPESPWRVLALAPTVLVLCAALWVEMRQIARMDELQRLLYLAATLTGSMVAVLFAAVAYMGEALELWARVAPIWVIAALGAGFVLGYVGARRRFA